MWAPLLARLLGGLAEHLQLELQIHKRIDEATAAEPIGDESMFDLIHLLLPPLQYP